LNATGRKDTEKIQAFHAFKQPWLPQGGQAGNSGALWCSHQHKNAAHSL